MGLKSMIARVVRRRPKLFVPSTVAVSAVLLNTPRLPGLSFQEYSQQARLSDVYPKTDTALGRLPVYPMLAALGELGEAAEKVKKAWRDRTPLVIDAFLRELGDVLWYLDAAAKDVGSDLEMVGRMNIEKLADRRARGVLAGTGDYR